MKLIDSRIEKVKLYHRGATIRRVAEIEAKGGRLPRHIEFSGLPLALDDESVRVEVEGSEPLQLRVSNFRVGVLARKPEEALSPPAQSKLKELEQELLKKTLLLQQLEKERQYIDGVPLPHRPRGEEGKAPPASPMAARLALEEFTHEAMERRIEESQGLRKELEELRGEVEALHRDLAAYASSQEVKAHALFKTVQAQLQQGEAEIHGLRLALEYFVPGARWTPAYQCRLQRDGSAAQIQMRALVSQQTGEDWKGVRLELSTASALQWTELPELSSIRIGRAQATPPGKKGFRPPPKGAGALFGDYEQAQRYAAGLLPSPPQWSPVPLYTAPLSLLNSVPEAPKAQPIRLGEDEASFMYTSKEDLDRVSLESIEEEESGFDFDDGYGEVAEKPLSIPKPQKKMAPAPPPMAPPPMPSPMARGAVSGSAIGGFGGATEIEADGMLSRLSSSEFKKKKRHSGTSDPASGRLRYTELSLSSPDHPQERGRLLPTQKAEGYRQSLARLSLRIQIDLMATIESAVARAHQHDQKASPPGAVDTQQSTGYFDYTYATDATVDVPSDGHAHSIAVGSRQAPCDMHYVVVPREDPHVYRVALLRNPLHAPLLPGPAEIYVGGEYILSTPLPVVAPQGEFRLWLGVEQAIKCARNTHYKESRSGAKVVAMSELNHAIEIELVNRLQREIRCEVHERIPQPDVEAEVVVEEGEVSPAWEEYDQEERGYRIDGGRRWKIDVAAGQSAQLNASYTIKIYANNELIGGNRREA